MHIIRNLPLGVALLAAAACGARVDGESEQTGSVPQPEFADPGCETQRAGTGWRNGFVAVAPSLFQARFTLYPHAPNIDAVVGLSNGPADAFTDLAAIVRLNPAGTIDVRKGSIYTADQQVQYSPGSENRIDMLVDMNARRYDVRWKGISSEDWLLIADDFPFRTEQAGASRLDNIARIVDSAAGSIDFCFHHVTAAGCNWSSAGETWKSAAMPAQSGRFRARFDAWTDFLPTDAVFGLSSGAADAFTELAAVVRFNDAGYIDVRDAGVYRADVRVPYGPRYGESQFFGEFLVDVDVVAKTYSVSVRNVSSQGRTGAYQRIATNYHFRSEQSAVAALDHFGHFLDYPTGTVGMCNFAIDY